MFRRRPVKESIELAAASRGVAFAFGILGLLLLLSLFAAAVNPKRILIAGFENAVGGLAAGETCTVTLAPEEAYGESNAEMIQNVPRKLMPEGVELKPGMVLQGQADDGRVDNFSVVSFTEDAVTLDANHPLAGKSLTFEIELVEIV